MSKSSVRCSRRLASYLVAFVVKRGEIDREKLVNSFSDLGAEHARPRHYIFLDEIPVDATKMHKVDMLSLKEIAKKVVDKT